MDLKKMDFYQSLNYAEGVIWLIAALSLRQIIAIKCDRHARACQIARIGFLLFALSDFIEGSLNREFHLWLWVLKIGCGIIFLIARVCYLGREDFKWTDRYFLFFLICLSVAVAVIAIS